MKKYIVGFVAIALTAVIFIMYQRPTPKESTAEPLSELEEIIAQHLELETEMPVAAEAPRDFLLFNHTEVDFSTQLAERPRLNLIAANFHNELSNQQVEHIFPHVEMKLAAEAIYNVDDAMTWAREPWFFALIAAETAQPGNIAQRERFGDSYSRTEIYLLRTGPFADRWGTRAQWMESQYYRIFRKDIEHHEPEISSIQGQSVTAFHRLLDCGGHALLAFFKMGEHEIRIVTHGDDLQYEQQRINKLVNEIIQGGPIDLSILSEPVPPENFRYDTGFITIGSAQAEESFGHFVPEYTLPGFGFTGATRSINFREDNFSATWQNHDLQNLIHRGTITLTFTQDTEHCQDRLTADQLSPNFINETAQHIDFEEILSQRLWTWEGENYQINFCMIHWHPEHGYVHIGINTDGINPEDAWNFLSEMLDNLNA